MALGTSVPPLAAVSSRTKRYLKTLQDPTLHSVFSLPARFNERLTLYAAVLLTALALAMDYRVVPLLYNGSTLWAMGILLVLVYRGKDRPADEAGATDLSPPSWGRLLAFGSLHALLLGVAPFARTPLASAGFAYTLTATATVAAKFIVLFPTWVLFPASQWRLLWRRYRPELLAALVVLLTFFPYRLFMLAWPRYSALLGRLVYLGALPFVPGLEYVAAPDPVVAGPSLLVEIVFFCSGVEGVYLFDYLFGLIVLLEWNRLNKRRALAGYGLGLGAILIANVVRIALIVVIGNSISPGVGVERFHVHAGWVFFSVVFLVFLWASYGWMLEPSAKKTYRSIKPETLSS